jgi:thioredoxin reductase (NADPH)
MSELETGAKTVTAEIIVVGGGPAGFTAGLYAARAGRKTIILEGRRGSRLSVGYKIENYPGFVAIDSVELLNKFKDQAAHHGADIRSEDAIDFNFSSETKYVVTKGRLYEGRAVILATGKPVVRENMISGEDKFLGQGVSYCATCDGPLFRGLPVGLLGSSDDAVEEVLELQDLGCRVHWIPGDSQMSESSTPRWKDIEKRKIPVYWRTKVKEIVGERSVEKVILEKDGKEETLQVAGFFVIRENLSSPLLARAGLRLDHRQCLSVDRFQRTNLQGVFAAGDLTCGGTQVVTAAGEGAMAAMQAVIYLRKEA